MPPPAARESDVQRLQFDPMLPFVTRKVQRQVTESSGHLRRLVTDNCSASPDIRLPASLGQQCIGYLPLGHKSR